MLKDEPLLSPAKIGTDGANTFPSAIKTSVDDGHLLRKGLGFSGEWTVNDQNDLLARLRKRHLRPIGLAIF